MTTIPTTDEQQKTVNYLCARGGLVVENEEPDLVSVRMPEVPLFKIERSVVDVDTEGQTRTTSYPTE